MNQMDDLKLLRLEEEKKHIDQNFIEELAHTLIDELVLWANKEIFTPRGGELTFKMTLGPPNAIVVTDLEFPLRPRMEFTTSFISEIYADAFSFPIISRRLDKETETFRQFEKTKQFRDCAVRFSSALPELFESNVADLFRPVCEMFVRLNQERQNNNQQLQPNEVRCRFIMFELMLVWTFFHELGHIVQGHYRMHLSAPSLTGDYSFYELDEITPVLAECKGLSMKSVAAGKVAPDLAAQARELMADAEATDQTLKYLVMKRRLTFNVWYLQLCSTSCMFQRFYNKYPDKLELSPARHPHPLIRDEASQLLGINWLADYLVATGSIKKREDANIPIAYLGTRASLITGLFRSHRIEKRDSSDRLPSYMELTINGRDQQFIYIKTLLPEIERQLPLVLEYHLIEMNSLHYWFGYLKAIANVAN